MMVSVLLRLRSSGILDAHPSLAAYVARGTARPAFRRALDAQMQGFTGSPPPGFAAWLDPSNFDGAGRQRRGLADLRVAAG